MFSPIFATSPLSMLDKRHADATLYINGRYYASSSMPGQRRSHAIYRNGAYYAA